MRIAAGVLLIIAAAFNGCAGSLYGFGGAVVTGGSAIMKEASKKAAADEGATVQDKENLAKFGSAMGKGEAAGGGLMLFGLFLLVMLGLQIAGAVLLFLGKAKKFVITVGGLGLLAEIVGIVLTSGAGGGFSWKNIFGLAGSVLAIIAAMQYGKAAAGAPPAPAAAA